MKLKKILGLTALAAIATFALAACGSSKSSSKDGETTVKVGVMTLSDTEKFVGIKFKRTWMTLNRNQIGIHSIYRLPQPNVAVRW